MKLIELEEVDSTNDYLKENIKIYRRKSVLQRSIKLKVEEEMDMYGKVIQMKISL